MPADELERLKQAVRMLSDLYVQSVGRISALEAIATRAVIDQASTEPDPVQYVQDLVRRMQQDLEGLAPAEPNSHQEQFARATESAMEDFIEQVLSKVQSGNAGVQPADASALPKEPI